MSTRHIRGNLVYRSAVEHTAAGDVAAADLANKSLLLVNKTSGAATAVTLPAAEYIGHAIKVVDAKGDAATNNITITPDSGTINGGATYVLSENYASVELVWDGTNWTVSAASLTSESVASQTITDLTATNATITTAGITTANATTANVTTANVTTLKLTDVGTINAAGTVIANATAIANTVTIVDGADDAAGVVLPAAVAGRLLAVYQTHATSGLKVYPPVNGTINDGSANAAVVQEGKSLALFLATSNSNYASIFTANA